MGGKTSFTWGDGILQDVDAEFARRKQLVDGQYIRPELLIAWYFGVSEDDAQKMMPSQPLTLEFGGGDA